MHFHLCKMRLTTFTFSVRKMMTPNVKSCYWQQWSEIECCAKLTKFWVSKTFIGIVCCWFTSLIVEKNCYLPTLKFKFEREISWRQMHKTDFLNDYRTNCETATRNLSGDWLRCYDLLFIPQGNFKPLIC